MEVKGIGIEDLPLAFGKHVIVDTRSGANSYSEVHGSGRALAQFIVDQGRDEFEAMSEQDQLKVMKLTVGAVMDRITGAEPDPEPVLVVGPYATINGCIHTKDLMLLRRRFEELSDYVAEPAEHDSGEGVKLDRQLMGMLDQLLAPVLPQPDPVDSVESLLATLFPGAAILRT